ncbi:TetR/AcrR family transcriptional regulator [Paenibacillus filicis]|uniref:TetR/AcrR family transcriptional regulator n=1 Tax=Paenibacillus filicis TaxID=669464 RepID=A0ABU9DVE0_9BACL
MARSKEFDESVVLHKAMLLFWEQGYEKTSLQDLVEHMGIHRRSLYDTFGDKHSLYLKALDRYGDLMSAALKSEASRGNSARQALRFIFDFMIEKGDDMPLGCLFVNSAIELAPTDEQIDGKTSQGFQGEEQLIADIIRRGQQSGEWGAHHDPELVAESLHNSLVGIRVLGRTSAGKEKLHRIADASLAALDK